MDKTFTSARTGRCFKARPPDNGNSIVLSLDGTVWYYLVRELAPKMVPIGLPKAESSTNSAMPHHDMMRVGETFLSGGIPCDRSLADSKNKTLAFSRQHIHPHRHGNDPLRTYLALQTGAPQNIMRLFSEMGEVKTQNIYIFQHFKERRNTTTEYYVYIARCQKINKQQNQQKLQFLYFIGMRDFRENFWGPFGGPKTFFFCFTTVPSPTSSLSQSKAHHTPLLLSTLAALW